MVRLQTQFKMACIGRSLLPCFTLSVVLSCQSLNLRLSVSVCGGPRTCCFFALLKSVIINACCVLKHCSNPQTFVLNSSQDLKDAKQPMACWTTGRWNYSWHKNVEDIWDISRWCSSAAIKNNSHPSIWHLFEMFSKKWASSFLHPTK